MTTSGLAALVALASMALAGGLVLLVLALRGLPPRPAPPTQPAGARRGPDDLRLRAGLAAGAALAVALVTAGRSVPCSPGRWAGPGLGCSPPRRPPGRRSTGSRPSPVGRRCCAG